MNPALRQARFDDGTTSLDESGAAAARAAAGDLRPPTRVFTSPSARCQETAVALDFDGVAVPDLGGLDAGRWRGLTLDEVAANEPEAVGSWLADPDGAPHGGESVRDVCERVGRWLDIARDADGRTLAVVEPDVVRAAVVHALGLPVSVFWRLDVAPLTATELSGRAGRWNLRVGSALTAGEL
nr:histidine phosphatase family protein [Streptomyces sp. S3(2020)]